MARTKRENINRLPPIDLDMDNPQHVQLWEYYQTKTKTGQGATWIRNILIAMMQAEQAAIDVPKTLAAREKFVLTGPPRVQTRYPMTDDPDEPHYVDPEEIP